MPTTTIRIEDELKARIAAAAERAGKSAHAFILDALSETVANDEVDEELHRLADDRWAALQLGEETVAWTDAKTYLRARAAGKKPAKPRPRKATR